jgi:small subunit ribosomal protein S17
MDVVVKKVVNKKTLTGLVTSDKMDKTIVVTIEGRILHPLYKKYVVRSKKYKVHDEKNEAGIGDKVLIEECRPLSKDKHFRLLAIVEKAR